MDYTEYFNPRNVKLTNFVDRIFNENVLEIQYNLASKSEVFLKGQITNFLEELMNRENMTIRLIKTILRNSDIFYRQQHQAGLEPDWRVTICIEASKFIFLKAKGDQTLFDYYIKNRQMGDSSIISSFIFAISANYPDMYVPQADGMDKTLMSFPIDIRFVTRKGKDGVERYPSWPYQYKDYASGSSINKIAVCDFYLD